MRIKKIWEDLYVEKRNVNGKIYYLPYQTLIDAELGRYSPLLIRKYPNWNLKEMYEN